MKIEKNIPLPTSRTRGRPAKYPFKDMVVGDSVFFPGESTTPGNNVYVAAQMHARMNGKKFSGRTMDGGLRIWRVA